MFKNVFFTLQLRLANDIFYLFRLKLYFVFDFNRVYNVNVKKKIFITL